MLGVRCHRGTDMMIHRLVSALLAVVALSPAANALTFVEVSVVCPLDGEKFKTYLAGSGTQIGIFLDLKPSGPTAAPWPIAKCPTSGFVIYKNAFSKSEITKLRPYVATSDYQALQRTQTNYYLAAKLQGFLNAPHRDVAYTLLRATWEAQPGRQYATYAAEALDAYKLALRQPYTDQKQWVTDQLVAGELERRLGKFKEAKARFFALSSNEKLSDTTPRAIVELQLKLVAERNAQPCIPAPLLGCFHVLGRQ